jgi:hypothetical protein
MCAHYNGYIEDQDPIIMWAVQGGPVSFSYYSYIKEDKAAHYTGCTEDPVFPDYF